MKNIIELKKYKIIKTRTYRIELRNILQYIYYKFNQPNIAKRKNQKINQYIFSLENFPERCPRIKEYKENIRKLVFDNYIVIYKISNNTRTNIYFTYISF